MGKEIIGYRKLTDKEKSLMNEAKGLGVEFGEFIEKLEDLEHIDKRWLAIGKTDIQKGLMSIVRSIAKPESF